MNHLKIQKSRFLKIEFEKFELWDPWISSGLRKKRKLYGEVFWGDIGESKKGTRGLSALKVRSENFSKKGEFFFFHYQQHDLETLWGYNYYVNQFQNLKISGHREWVEVMANPRDI